MTLKLRPRNNFTFDKFRVGENEALIAQIRASARCWIYGRESVGKSHLVHAIASECEDSIIVDSKDYDLAGLDQFSLVVLDDVEQWTGSNTSEIALLDLHESLASRNARLIVTAHLNVFNIEFALKDLQSRMRSFVVLELLPLPDNVKLALMQERASDRGMVLTDEVAQYMFARMGRSQGELLNTLEKLDDESVLQARKLTIPFVKQVLGL